MSNHNDPSTGPSSVLRQIAAIATLACAIVAGSAGCDGSYGFDRVTAGEQDAATPRTRTNSQLLRAVYADILGRTPEVYPFVVNDPSGTPVNTFEVDESTFLLAALDSAGDDRVMRAIIINGLVHSQEAGIPEKSEVTDASAFIRDQFRRLLGREPTTYELNAFVSEWQAGDAVGPREVVRAILLSREYQSF